MKITLLSLLALVFSVSAHTQGLMITWQQTEAKATTNESIVDLKAAVFNQYFSTFEFRIRWDLSKVTPPHLVNVCFGELCYPTNIDPMDLPPFYIGGNTTDTLKIQLLPLMTVGVSEVEFVLFGANDPSDSVVYRGKYVIDIPGSVPLLSDLSEIVFGPNPCADRFTIAGNVIAGVESATVYSPDGYLVMSLIHDRSTLMEFPVSSLSSGKYFVIFQMSGGKARSHSFVVTR